MRVQRSISASLREGLSTEQAWHGADGGLIACWERGRRLATEDSGLSKLALEGQLVPLPWKGGVEKKLKQKIKVGTLRYLAMWQGLRGEDLDIETEAEPAVRCTVHGQTVLFTNDHDKYGDA